jgi:hypothetical protein
MDEVEALQTIEALFSADRSADTDLFQTRRSFSRWQVDLRAELRGNRIADEVRIVDLNPSGMVVRAAPYAERGQTVEVVVEDHELSLSYRFKAVVTWRRDDDDDDFSLGLELVGTPILVRRHRSSDADVRPVEAARAAA